MKKGKVSINEKLHDIEDFIKAPFTIEKR